MYCYTSHQIADYAYTAGIQQIEEIEQEKRMLRSLRMGKKYLRITGRRHCRLGIKPLNIMSDYLDGYSRQYVRENQPFRIPF